ncbi:MAG: hypothetical protein HY089_12940 [Ignavibacteriales bacterium]|nr:hypothetical protein [Ignavibacteriales bacterium]
MNGLMKYSNRLLLLCSVAVLSVSVVQAQYAEDVLRFSLFNTPVSARSMGMGNTSVGVANDFSSLFNNPAGLAAMKSFEFSVGLSNAGYNNDVAFYGINTKSDNRITNLNNLGIVYPIPTTRGSLTFAFGYARVANYTTSATFDGFNPSSSLVDALTPYDNLNSMSKQDADNLLRRNIPYQIFLADTAQGKFYPLVTDSVQQTATVREGGGMNNWSLGGAIDVAKNLSLGVGINILSGTYTYDRIFNETDTRNVYRVKPFDFDRFRYESNIQSDISGYNLLIGFMYRKQGVFKIGATVRTPTYYEISENFSDAGYSFFDNGDKFDHKNTGSTKYNIKTPVVMSGGASVQIGDWLTLAGDAEYTDWTQMEFTDTDNADLIDENRYIQSAFRATTNLRGGAEVTLWSLGLKLRGGAGWNPSQYKNDPKEYDQIYYTVGAGIALEENLSINAALTFGNWKTFRDNYYIPGLAAPSRTKESVTTDNVNITFSYRF